MLKAEENRRVLEEIDAGRRFLLLAFLANPDLAARAEGHVRQMAVSLQSEPQGEPQNARLGRIP